jgi:hypothetical protein
MAVCIIARNYKSLTEEVGFGHLKGQCAALVQWYGCNLTRLWRRGAPVKGNPHIVSGTCIATFRGTRYPNSPSGNHAAIYVEQDRRGSMEGERLGLGGSSDQPGLDLDVRPA